MNTVWIVGGAAIVLAVIVLVRSWHRRGEPQDLGAVSHQWVNEHRLGHQNAALPAFALRRVRRSSP